VAFQNIRAHYGYAFRNCWIDTLAAHAAGLNIVARTFRMYLKEINSF
jgi:hypothetical protein